MATAVLYQTDGSNGYCPRMTFIVDELVVNIVDGVQSESIYTDQNTLRISRSTSGLTSAVKLVLSSQPINRVTVLWRQAVSLIKSRL